MEVLINRKGKWWSVRSRRKGNDSVNKIDFKSLK